MRRRTASIVLSAAIAMVIAARASAISWITPSAGQPEGNIAPSINTSSTAQTKEGGLIISNALATVNGSPALTLGSPGEYATFCLNGTDAASCRSSWADFATLAGKLRLSPQTADSGFLNITAPGIHFVDQFETDGSVRGIAGTPTSTLSTSGVYAEASSSPGPSYGIYAQNLAGLSSHSAIYADTYLPEVGPGAFGGWAGYFNGNVAVSNAAGGTCRNNPSVSCSSDATCTAIDSNDSCVPYPSVLIGGLGMPDYTNAASFPMNVGYLCLGSGPNRCRSSWPVVAGSGLWTGTASQVSPNAPQLTRSLAVAGSGMSAGLSVHVTSDSSNTPVRADATLNGSASFDKYTVGVAPNGEPVAMTCGNNKCEGLENDDFTSRYYCPQDCDHTPPDNVQVDIIDQIMCQIDRRGHIIVDPDTGCGISRPPTFYLYWSNPLDYDYAGVRIIVNDTRYPTDYRDLSSGTILGGDFTKDVTSYVVTCPVNNKRYYVGLYSYDNVGNFSTGVNTMVMCTTALVTRGGGGVN